MTDEFFKFTCCPQYKRQNSFKRSRLDFPFLSYFGKKIDTFFQDNDLKQIITLATDPMFAALKQENAPKNYIAYDNDQ